MNNNSEFKNSSIRMAVHKNKLLVDQIIKILNKYFNEDDKYYNVNLNKKLHFSSGTNYFKEY
jgi:hypothetical protein